MKPASLFFVAILSLPAFAAQPESSWVCSIALKTTHDNRLYAFLRSGQIAAGGILNCVSRNGDHTPPVRVAVNVKQATFQIGFLFPANQGVLDLLQIRAGVVSPGQIFGRFKISKKAGQSFAASSDTDAKARFQVAPAVSRGIGFGGSIVDIEPARN